MMPHLTVPQRLVAAGAAAATATFLWMQVEEYGIGDSPWLVSIIVIAVLLAIASHGGSAAAEKNSNQNAKTETAGSAATKKALSADYVFTSARNTMDKFYNSVEAGSSNISSGGLRAWKPVLIRKSAFMLTFLLFAKKVPTFPSTRDANGLRDISINGLTDVGEMAMMAAGGPLTVDRPRLAKEAQRNTVECEEATYEAMRRLASDEAYPLDPIYCLLDQEAGVRDRSSHDREEFYGAAFKTWFRLFDEREMAVDSAATEKPYAKHQVSLPSNSPLQDRGSTRSNKLRGFDGQFQNWLSNLTGYEEHPEGFSITLPSTSVFMIGATVHKIDPSVLRSMRWNEEVKARIVNCFAEVLSPEDVSGARNPRPIPVRMRSTDWPRLLRVLGATRTSDPHEEAELLKATGQVREALIARGLTKDDPSGFMTVEMPLRGLMAVAAALIRQSPSELGLTKEAHRHLVNAVGSSTNEKWGKTPLEQVPTNEPAEARASMDDWRVIERFLDQQRHTGLLATYAPAIASLIRVERRLRTATQTYRASEGN